MIVDATHVYWLGGQGTNDAIFKAPLGGGPTVQLAANQNYITDLAVDNTFIYYVTQGDRGLKKVHK